MFCPDEASGITWGGGGLTSKAVGTSTRRMLFWSAGRIKKCFRPQKCHQVFTHFSLCFQQASSTGWYLEAAFAGLYLLLSSLSVLPPNIENALEREKITTCMYARLFTRDHDVSYRNRGAFMRTNSNNLRWKYFDHKWQEDQPLIIQALQARQDSHKTPDPIITSSHPRKNICSELTADGMDVWWKSVLFPRHLLHINLNEISSQQGAIIA